MSKKNSPVISIVVGLIFIALALLFMSMGVHQALRQSRMLSTFLPVSARIACASIASHRGSKGRMTYTPEILFTYDVAGHHETSKTPLINNQSGSYAWAQQLVDRFPTGAATTAWRSPTGVNQAFLVHEADFGVYTKILLPMLHLSLGVLMLLGGLGFGLGSPRRWPLLLIASGTWDFVGACVFIHFGLVGGHWTTAPIMALVIYGGLSAAMTIWLIRILLQMRARMLSLQGEEPNPYRAET